MIDNTVFNYTVPLRPWTFLAELPATVQSPLSKLVRLATEFEAPLCIAVKKLGEKKFKKLYGMYISYGMVVRDFVSQA